MIVVSQNTNNSTTAKTASFIAVALGLAEPPKCNWFCKHLGGPIKWLVSNLGIPFAGAIGNLIDAFGTLREAIDLSGVDDYEAYIVENWINDFLVPHYESLLIEANALIFADSLNIREVNSFLNKVAIYKGYIENEIVPELTEATKLLRDEYATSLLFSIEQVVFDELDKKQEQFEIIENEVSSTSFNLSFLLNQSSFTATSTNYKDANDYTTPVDTTNEVIEDTNTTENTATEPKKSNTLVKVGAGILLGVGISKLIN